MIVVGALASMVHGGVLVAFALLLGFRARLTQVPEIMLVRVFRAAGSILGLSLGAFILANAWRWPELHNPGAVGLDRYAVPAEQALRVAIFGAYWVSYTVLEVWTLDPLRLLDKGSTVADPTAYGRSAAALSRHLVVNAILFSLVVALGE